MISLLNPLKRTGRYRFISEAIETRAPPHVLNDGVPRIVLHIGTHKTGTTSIQHFLAAQGEFLARNGFHLCCGLGGKANFKELFHASVLKSRRSLAVIRKPRLFGLGFRFRLRRHIKGARERAQGRSLILSTELLSFLRYADEIRALAALFPRNTAFTVVLCLRNKQDFIESYRRQLEKQGIPLGGKQGDANYLENDTWLTDYDSLIQAFRFLTDDIRVIDYDRAVRDNQNIIDVFCETLAITEKTNPAALIRLNDHDASAQHARNICL